MTVRVLIVSTSMGAGHDRVAGELARRLAEAGHDSLVVDHLDLLALRLGPLMRWYYRMQLRYAPWSYETTFRLLPRLHGLFCLLNGVLAGPRLQRTVTRFDPHVIVSNNPHASLTLGWLRQHDKLAVPAVTYVTDLGVHALWVHPAVDHHLVVHVVAAADAVAFAQTSTVTVCQPLIPARSSHAAVAPVDPSTLDVPTGKGVALITCGSWGVGQVEATVSAMARSTALFPVVACGQDQALLARLLRRDDCAAVGWVDDLAPLMASARVVIENAGGSSALESIAAGIPLITFRPIPGHGVCNAHAMARAGLTRFVRDDRDLVKVAEQAAVDGPDQSAAAAWRAAPDPAGLIIALVSPAPADGRIGPDPPGDEAGPGGAARTR